MFFTVLLKNPRAIEPAVNLAAMFIHFQKQSRFIIDRITKEIESFEHPVDEDCAGSIRQGSRNFMPYGNRLQEMEIEKSF
jgi:hypothetical protein